MSIPFWSLLVAALMPCQWGYWEIGDHLARQGEPKQAPLYCQWIRMYASEEFAALAQQIFVGSQRFNAEGTVAGIVVIAIVRELGPVLGGLMVAGRVSSAMAAELGTMRVTEQIDALTTLSTDPYKYLVVPRLVAAVLTLPILVIVANIIGVFGGFLIGTQKLGFNVANYLQITVDFLEASDITSSLVKAAMFGFIIAIMGSYHGYNSSGGAQGVGRATTNAVVSAFILILLSNLIITVNVFGT